LAERAAFFDARARAEDGAEKSRCPADGESTCSKCIFFLLQKKGTKSEENVKEIPK